jgi:hypothetical protein
MRAVLWHGNRSGFHFKNKQDLNRFLKALDKQVKDIKRQRGAKDFMLIFDVEGDIVTPAEPESKETAD